MPVSPASPPKRMTRARAKAVEEKQKTSTITTPAARIASAAAKQLIRLRKEISKAEAEQGVLEGDTAQKEAEMKVVVLQTVTTHMTS